MKRVLTLILVAGPIFLCSQDVRGGSGGSGYSRYGIGDIRFFSGGRAAGMGGTTVALLSPNSINRLNPAGQTKISKTHFTGTFAYEGFNTTDGTNSSYLSSGNFGGAVLAFPVSPGNGITLSLGFNPYSTINHKVQVEETFATQTYSQLYFGEGGLSTALAGVSFMPFDSLHLGLRVNYLFGQIRTGSDITFSDVELVSTKYRRTVNTNGFNVTLGLIYTGLGELTRSRALTGLNIGAMLSTATNLSATQENINITSVGNDTLGLREGQIHIPLSGGLGFAWLLGEKYLLAGDFLYQNWGNFRFYGEHPPQIRNSSRVSFGLEIQPSREMGASYWRRVAYRFGTYYLSSYYRIGSNSINEMALTAGIGMPIGGDARLDLALEYGRRGTTDQQLLRDNIVRFSITINAGERWFVRFEEE